MTAKSFSLWLPALLGICLGLVSNTFAAATLNILLIIADDYGVDSSSLYNATNNGASLPPTPNIEALARSGVVFRNAYATPLCSPTRCCLITGRYAFRTGVGDVIAGVNDATLTPGEFTLPDAFAANSSLGYAYAQFGKWHLHNGPNSPRAVGGWQHFAGSIQGEVASYTNWTKNIDGVVTANYTNYATTDVVTDTIAWIQARGSQPWFAWVAFNAPHTPFHLPPTNLCPHYTSLSGTQSNINAHPRPCFEAMVEAMDTEIGRLLSAVNRTNTHIIFLGDNGTTGQVIQPPFASAHSKGTLYEGGIRVPLLISGPAVANPGRTNDMRVHMVDLYPTILEMAGISVSATVPASKTIDGQSLLPVLGGATDSARRVYIELFNTNSPSADDGRGLRNAQFKLLRFTVGAREEFYDLVADPNEQTNLLNGALTPTQLSNYYSLTLGFGGYQDDYAQPALTHCVRTGSQFTVTVKRDASLTCAMWRASELSELAWAPVTNAIAVTNNSTTVTLTDTNAAGPAQFYRVLGTAP
jgi:arylsulfatase A-like enzyme